jgi:site-specific recombinase XerD
MKTSTTFSIHFWLKKTSTKNDGRIPIYARITVDGNRADLSLKRYVYDDHWCSKSRRASNRSSKGKDINSYLDFVYNKLIDCHQQLCLENSMVSAQAIKLRYLGKDKEVQTLVDLIKYHGDHEIKKLQQGTVKNYAATEKYLNTYINIRFKASDVYLSQVDYAFVMGFEDFLRICEPLRKSQPLKNNGIMKHMERLQKFTTLALRYGWLKENPFAHYTLRFDEFDSAFLEQPELNGLRTFDMGDGGMKLARDVFVFACYTGLSYIDVKNLTASSIITGIDGEPWIMIRRTKSKTAVKVPLLDEAKEILEFYTHHPKAINDFALLPVLSSQKTNAYLKTIAERCNIPKKLTFHVARHTFATTITLLNNVPIETVAKLLGHTKLTTTQKYARVIEKKISKDITQLKFNLKINSKSEPPIRNIGYGHLHIV